MATKRLAKPHPKKTALTPTPKFLMTELNNQGPVDTPSEIQYRYYNNGPVDTPAEQQIRYHNPGPKDTLNEIKANQVPSKKSEHIKENKKDDEKDLTPPTQQKR